MISNETYRFTATASGVLADFSHLTLYNGNLDTVLKGYGKIDGALPKGLYKLVTVLNDRMTEKYIKLTQDTNEMLTLDATSSSVLATGLGNTHEYYSETAKANYSVPTTANGDNSAKESIFIFFRYPDEVAFKSLNPSKESLGKHFRLLDQRRKPICLLSGKDIKEDVKEFGYLLFNIKLQPGTYFLNYSGRKADKNSPAKSSLPAREIPITVFANWQTQCFITFGNGPIFKSLFVAMRNVEYSNFYNPDTNCLYDIEGILQKFNNGIYYLPPAVLETLTYGKWENPILGLLAAYAYFKSNQTGQEQLFHNVVANLSQMLGNETPDVVALSVLAASHFNELVPFSWQISSPCMFLPGMKSVLESKGSLIQPDSIAESVVDKFYQDMVWTSYLPPTSFRGITERHRASGKKGGFYPGDINILFDPGVAGRGSIFDKLLGEGQESKGRQGSFEKHPSRKRITNPRPKILSSWIANSVMDILTSAKDPIPNAEQMASRLKITPNILNQAVDQLLDSEDAIFAYLSGKKASVEFEAFNITSFRRLKLLRFERLGTVPALPELEPA
jgi:hypothetical protein